MDTKYVSPLIVSIVRDGALFYMLYVMCTLISFVPMVVYSSTLLGYLVCAHQPYCQVTNVHARWFIVRLAVVLLIGIVVVEVSTNLAARTSAILTLYVSFVCTLMRGGTIEISSGGASVSILGV